MCVGLPVTSWDHPTLRNSGKFGRSIDRQTLQDRGYAGQCKNNARETRNNLQVWCLLINSVAKYVCWKFYGDSADQIFSDIRSNFKKFYKFAGIVYRKSLRE
jgi:hypothetical protein